MIEDFEHINAMVQTLGLPKNILFNDGNNAGLMEWPDHLVWVSEAIIKIYLENYKKVTVGKYGGEQVPIYLMFYIYEKNT